jgi:hypothetical protein
MEAASCSKMLAAMYQTIQCHIPKDHRLKSINMFLGKIHKNKIRQAGTQYKSTSTGAWRRNFIPMLPRTAGNLLKYAGKSLNLQISASEMIVYK